MHYRLRRSAWVIALVLVAVIALVASSTWQRYSDMSSEQREDAGFHLCMGALLLILFAIAIGCFLALHGLSWPRVLGWIRDHLYIVDDDGWY